MNAVFSIPAAAGYVIMVQNSIETKISQSWAVLAGSSLQFARDAMPAAPDWVAQHFIVPIQFLTDTVLGGVVVEISDKQARLLAATMFDVALSEVSVADVQDACNELCNVFSACVSVAFSSCKESDLGLPRCLPADEFRRIFEASRLDGCFAAHNTHGFVTIYLFDPLHNDPLNPLGLA